MAAFYRLLALTFWLLGLLTTVLVVVARLTRPLRLGLEAKVEMRSLLWLAGVFFLGAIATWTRERIAPT